MGNSSRLDWNKDDVNVEDDIFFDLQGFSRASFRGAFLFFGPIANESVCPSVLVQFSNEKMKRKKGTAQGVF